MTADASFYAIYVTNALYGIMNVVIVSMTSTRKQRDVLLNRCLKRRYTIRWLLLLVIHQDMLMVEIA